jgi:ribosome-associated protein
MNKQQEFQLSEDYIELIKLLKLLNLVESGADAKISVEEGLVNCNGEIEYRKRKKLRTGDVVVFKNNQINIL